MRQLFHVCTVISKDQSISLKVRCFCCGTCHRGFIPTPDIQRLYFFCLWSFSDLPLKKRSVFRQKLFQGVFPWAKHLTDHNQSIKIKRKLILGILHSTFQSCAPFGHKLHRFQSSPSGVVWKWAQFQSQKFLIDSRKFYYTPKFISSWNIKLTVGWRSVKLSRMVQRRLKWHWISLRLY